MTIIAAADGSALGNPGPAGWGWYVDPSCWACGGWPHGTNNMGELTAVLDLLQQTAHLDEDLEILCDSKYAIDTITKWMAGWKKKGWKKSDGKPVANLEIVQALDVAMRERRGKVTFTWVKGHAGHHLNEEADRVANSASLAYKEGRTPAPGPGFGNAGDTLLGAGRAEQFDLFEDADEGVSSDDAVLSVEEEILDVREHVLDLERLLLTDHVRSDVSMMAELLHPDWSEVGRSGRLLSRASFLEGVGPIGPVEMEVLEVSETSPGTVLVVWRSHGRAGATLRSSWWIADGERWVQRFHHASAERA